jgi:thioredoxin reductase
MQVPESDAATFETAVTAPVPVLVEFGSPWCPVCKAMERPLASLALERAGEVAVVKVDVEQHPAIADRHGVMGLPTFVLFAAGEVVWRATGGRSLEVLRAEVGAALDALDAVGAPAAPVVAEPGPADRPTVAPSDGLPVGVIGAGPVGLAAAANLAERAIPFVVFEAGDAVGAAIRDWAHVQLFSPWAFDMDPAGRRLLEAAGWAAPEGDVYPTGAELVDRYLAPLGALPALAGSIRTRSRVAGVAREGYDKLRTAGRAERAFVVTVETPAGLERVRVRALIDASGTWRSPNPLGASGLPAIGERALAPRITAGIPDVAGRDRTRYAGRRVAVVGSGHSAQNVVRDLARLAADVPGTAVTWIIRRAEPGTMFGGDRADRLPERGRLGADSRSLVEAGRVRLEAGFRVDGVVETDGGIMLVAADGREAGPFDEVVTATGFRPDVSFLSEVRVDLDPVVESSRALAPLIDPNVHSCGSVPPHGAAELAHPEPGLYLVGAKSYGRAPTFLLATGYEQVRSVVAELAGDHAAAADVRLVLPETGVCSRTSSPTAAPAAREPELVGAAAATAERTGAPSACCG